MVIFYSYIKLPEGQINDHREFGLEFGHYQFGLGAEDQKLTLKLAAQ